MHALSRRRRRNLRWRRRRSLDALALIDVAPVRSSQRADELAAAGLRALGPAALLIARLAELPPLLTQACVQLLLFACLDFSAQIIY